MRRLITILAVFSLACLGAGVAFAESAPPAGYNIIDFVNVGDAAGANTEGGRNMDEWGPSFDAGIWFSPEYSDYYRQIWGWTTPPAGYPAGTDSENWAEIDIDFTKPAHTGQLNIGFFFLAGTADDNFYVYIDGTLIGEVTESQTSNTMVRKFLAVPTGLTTGIHTVKLECSEVAGGGQATYGQVTIDEIYTFTDPLIDPIIEPVAVNSDPINCSGSKLVNFHYWPGLNADVRGYTVRVSCDVSLTFGPGDITIFDVPTGLTYTKFVTEITPGQVYDVDYVIMGGSVGISTEADLFSVNFHGEATGTGVVSITSVNLGALDGTPITPVVFTGTANIEVDCTAPETSVDGLPTYVDSFFDITYTVDLETGSGVTGADLYYQKGGGGYSNYGPFTGNTIAFDATTTGGDGVYEFYSIATDGAGNVESAPGVADATTTVDTTPPGGVTDLTANRGFEKVALTWTNPGGDQTEVEMWRAVWHDGDHSTSVYPEYDDVVGNVIPTVPGNRAAADADPDWFEVDLSSETYPFSTFTDDPLDRGLYYYVVYPVDGAGLYGDGDDASSLSYLLGDVAHPYDGRVTGADISDLGLAYGTIEVIPNPDPYFYNNECDIGPTDDYSGAGIPDTDNVIGFEDLMIFALNWDVTLTKAPTTEGSMIARFSWVKVDETTWSLVLAEPCANLKGVNLQADLPQDAALSVTAGSLLRQQDHPYFLKNIPANGLDAGMALLGNGACITGQGELIRISLAGEFDPEDILIVARDSANKDLEYSVEETTAAADMPTRYALSANYPNPFNPSTKIEFALPEAQLVRLAIFAVDGRRIATLKNESMPAGHHSVTWTGRDDRGGLVAAGIYFYRIQAGDFSQTQKMTLVK